MGPAQISYLEHLDLGQINAMVQDSTGFMWFATGNGLARFDGLETKWFRNNPLDSLSIAGNVINDIDIDRLGNVWLALAFDGVDMLDVQTGRFYHYRRDQRDSTSLSSDLILEVMVDDHNGVLAVTEHELGYLEPGKDGFIEVINEELDLYWMISVLIGKGLSNDFLLKDKNGRIGFAGYYYWDPETKKVIEPQNAKSEELSGIECRTTLAGYSNEGFWLICNDTLLICTNKDITQQNPDFYRLWSTEERRPKAIRILSNNSAFATTALLTGDGICLLDTTAGIFIMKFAADPWFSELLATHPSVSYEDYSGRVWIVVDNHVFTLHFPKKGFQQITMPGNRVNSIAQWDMNTLYIGTNQGIMPLFKNPSTYAGMDSKSVEDWQLGHPGSPMIDGGIKLLNQRVQKITRDSEGQMRVTFYSDSYSFYLFTPDERKLEEQRTSFYGKIHSWIEYPPRYLHITGSYLIQTPTSYKPPGTVWLPGNEAAKWDYSDNSAQVLPKPCEQCPAGSHLRSILLDDRRRLWVSSDQAGLYWSDAPQDTFYSASFYRPEDSTSLSSNIVYDMVYSPDGRIWMGTGFGLNVFDPESGKTSRYLINGELKDERILSLAMDYTGLLWLGTPDGLYRFNTDSKHLQRFETSDGLPSNTFLEASKYVGADGTLFWGMEDGLLYYKPDHVSISTDFPRLYLAGLDLNHQNVVHAKDEYVDKDPNYLRELTLPHHQNNVTIRFGAIEFGAPQEIRFRYRLRGLSDAWVLSQGDREAVFNNLRHDVYTFELISNNEDGIWNDQPLILSIHILPPWWLSWWAKTLYVLIGLYFLRALYNWRTREQQKKLAQREQELARERLLNEQLKKVDQLKNQFLANTSHELKTPLHGIIGIAESLFDEAENKTVGDLRQNLGMIMASGKRLASLVNDLLDFSRARSRDLQIQPKNVDLKSIVDIVVRSCKPLIIGKPVSLINAIPADLQPVVADENRLQQVLFNLVGNAVKFTREGTITIKAQKQDHRMEVCVEDTGIGIPEEKHESIFNFFEQVDGSTQREFGGTGLGLSITKQLVELHGGNIWVRSKPGEGSRFYFTLLISDQNNQISPIRNTVSTIPLDIEKVELTIPVAGAAEDRIRILVVDDEPINHQVLKNYLKSDQYLITSVMSGEEAIQAIQLGAKFDLVLLDVMMPRISGYEVCQEIRKKYLPSELPIIMITAKNQIEDLVQGLSDGANDYLAKPFSKDEFLARVKTQLDLHRIFQVADRFVPNEFLQALGHERMTEVALGDSVQREMSILFSDIRDYTSLAEGMTPQECFRLINSYHSRIGPIIRDHRGFVNQYLGDGMLSLFPESAADALNAAVEVQKEILAYNRHRIMKGRRELKVGIGIHTGSLVMGIIGDEKRMNAATIADTVNTAARIESLTKYYSASILLSENSLDQLINKTTFHFRFLGKIQVIGKKNPVGIFECLDGDLPEVAALKIKTKEVFETGLQQFFNREFPEAVATFNNILKMNAYDQTARIFMNRSSEFLLKGVPDDWTGVVTMTFK